MNRGPGSLNELALLQKGPGLHFSLVRMFSNYKLPAVGIELAS